MDFATAFDQALNEQLDATKALADHQTQVTLLIQAELQKEYGIRPGPVLITTAFKLAGAYSTVLEHTAAAAAGKAIRITPQARVQLAKELGPRVLGALMEQFSHTMTHLKARAAEPDGLERIYTESEKTKHLQPGEDSPGGRGS